MGQDAATDLDGQTEQMRAPLPVQFSKRHHESRDAAMASTSPTGPHASKPTLADQLVAAQERLTRGFAGSRSMTAAEAAGQAAAVVAHSLLQQETQGAQSVAQSSECEKQRGGWVNGDSQSQRQVVGHQDERDVGQLSPRAKLATNGSRQALPSSMHDDPTDDRGRLAGEAAKAHHQSPSPSHHSLPFLADWTVRRLILDS